MPVDPRMALGGVGGPEWTIAPVDGPAQPAATGTGFGDVLGNALAGLQASQTEAATGAQALAAGTATDPTSVVMAVERARLAMQLASQVRNKAVEAVQDIFHTQV